MGEVRAKPARPQSRNCYNGSCGRRSGGLQSEINRHARAQWIEFDSFLAQKLHRLDGADLAKLQPRNDDVFELLLNPLRLLRSRWRSGVSGAAAEESEGEEKGISASEPCGCAFTAGRRDRAKRASCFCSASARACIARECFGNIPRPPCRSTNSTAPITTSCIPFTRAPWPCRRGRRGARTIRSSAWSARFRASLSPGAQGEARAARRRRPGRSRAWRPRWRRWSASLAGWTPRIPIHGCSRG